jgi:hypothetical protein
MASATPGYRQIIPLQDQEKIQKTPQNIKCATVVLVHDFNFPTTNPPSCFCPKEKLQKAAIPNITKENADNFIGVPRI